MACSRTAPLGKRFRFLAVEQRVSTRYVLPRTVLNRRPGNVLVPILGCWHLRKVRALTFSVGLLMAFREHCGTLVEKKAKLVNALVRNR